MTVHYRDVHPSPLFRSYSPTAHCAKTGVDVSQAEPIPHLGSHLHHHPCFAQLLFRSLNGCHFFHRRNM